MPQFFIDRPIFAWVVALFIVLAGALADVARVKRMTANRAA